LEQVFRPQKDDLFHIRLMQVIKSNYFTLLVCLKMPKTTSIKENALATETHCRIVIILNNSIDEGNITNNIQLSYNNLAANVEITLLIICIYICITMKKALQEASMAVIVYGCWI
jgi:hypothetical protein